MYKGIELSASVMCFDWLNVSRQMAQISGQDLDYLHFDVVDGRFAADFTMGTSIINKIRNGSDLRSDYHLMVEEPSRVVPSFDFGECDYVTIHQEAARNLHRDLVSIRRSGGKVGVALSPATPASTLEYIIEDVDLVLLMTVNPGFAGQAMVPQVLRKITEVRRIVTATQLPNIRVGVDGSVNPRWIPEMVACGADRLILGSSGLFREDVDIEEALQQVRRAIDEGLAARNGRFVG